MANSELLSQDEIDALLSGVDSGDVETDTEDALSPGEQDVNAFDFASQDRIVRGRMPTLEVINERFARNMRTSLFKMLRRAPGITMEGVQMTKYSEYIHTLNFPSHLNMIKIPPLRGTGMLVFDPKLVFSLVDCFFGGAGSASENQSGGDFTATEHRIAHRVFKDCVSAMKDAWSPVLGLDVSYQSTEVNPQFANLVTMSEIVAISSFHIDLEIGSGDIHVVMPYSMLEPLREVLDGEIAGGSGEKDERWGARLQEEIKSASVKINTTLAKAQISVRDVMNMKPGDVISIDMPESITARVSDIPVFRAKYGTSRGNLALRVEDFVNHGAVAPLENEIGVAQ